MSNEDLLNDCDSNSDNTQKSIEAFYLVQIFLFLSCYYCSFLSKNSLDFVDELIFVPTMQVYIYKKFKKVLSLYACVIVLVLNYLFHTSKLLQLSSLQSEMFWFDVNVFVHLPIGADRLVRSSFLRIIIIS